MTFFDNSNFKLKNLSPGRRDSKNMHKFSNFNNKVDDIYIYLLYEFDLYFLMQPHIVGTHFFINNFLKKYNSTSLTNKKFKKITNIYAAEIKGKIAPKI